MRQDFFEYIPQFKLLVAGNHKPGLRSVDEAIRRRLHLIPFTVTIGERERDPYLCEKLKAEYPGIFRWAIEGCRAWQRDGLNPPDIVRSATSDYLAAEDAIGRWIDDRCALGRIAGLHSRAYFLTGSSGANRLASGQEPKSDLRRPLEARGFVQHRTGPRRGFDGITLREDLAG